MRYVLYSLFLVQWVVLSSAVSAQTYGQRDAILREEFIYQSAPFPSCHAVSLVETTAGTLMATWFGGYHENHKRVGIWTSRKTDGGWTPPAEVANGLQENGDYLATWNPVLFQPKEGPLMLFFKVGPTPADWWGEMMVSEDDGKTWKNRVKLPEGGIGPVRNKPIETTDGRILCPSSDEAGDVWTSHLEIMNPRDGSWTRTPPLHSKEEAQTIQPTLLPFDDGRMLMLCRDKNSNGKIWQCLSNDDGKTWGRFSTTELPNPNSGIDAVALQDGRFLLAYNHSVRKPVNPDDPPGRDILNLAISSDGVQWRAVCIFENSPKSEFSYPAIIQTKDGLVHVAYTWQRRLMKHVVLDPEKISGIPIRDGQWPN